MNRRVMQAAAALFLAGCGGGGGPSVATQPAPSPGPHTVTLTGTRTISTNGTVPCCLLSPGTFTATETDATPQFAAKPAPGTTYTVARTLTYAAPPATPASGVQPQSETVQEHLRIAADGAPAFADVTDTTTGEDRDAEQHVPTKVTDVRTVTTTYGGPLAAVEHVVEKATGANGVTTTDIDLTRTTNADGSFDETGRLGSAETHTLHVHADFSAVAHDQVPGFSLRDVTVATPTGSGAGATVAVTVSTQGRDVGNPPIVTNTYTTPRWFNAPPTQPAPAYATRTLFPDVKPDPACGLVLRALLARDEHIRVDTAAGTYTAVRHDAYFDDNGALVCRSDSTVYAFHDVTTGDQTGAYVDSAVMTTATFTTGTSAGTQVRRFAPTGTR